MVGSSSAEAAAVPLGRVLAALALGSMLTPLNSTMISVVLDDIGGEFGVNAPVMMQALVTSYLIVSIVMQAPAGKLGDRFGHLSTVRVGLGLFALGSVAAIASSSLVPLALARVVMAIGGALVVPSAAAIIRIHVPVARRASAFGIFGASMAFSAAAGPVVGSRIMALASHAHPDLPPFIESLVGFRACFLLNLLIVPIALGLLPRISSPTPRASSGFDWVGSALLGATLTSLVVGANQLGSVVGAALVVASACGVLAFAKWEQRHAEPIVDLALLRNPVFVAGGLIIGMQNLAMYALLFELPLVLAGEGGLDRTDRGKLLTIMMAAMVVVSPISGRLSDRFGPRKVAVVGAALGLSGIAGLYAVGLAGVSTLAPPMVLFGLGLGLSASPSQASAMSVSPAEVSGVASAMLAIHRYLGGILGTVVLAVLAIDSSSPAAALESHRRALMIFGAALVLSATASTWLPSRLTEPVAAR